MSLAKSLRIQKCVDLVHSSGLYYFPYRCFPVIVSANDFNPSPMYPLALWINDCVKTLSPVSNKPDRPRPVGSDWEEEDDDEDPNMSLFSKASLTVIKTFW